MNRYDPKARPAKRQQEELTLMDDSGDALLHSAAPGARRAPAFNPYNRELPVAKSAAATAAERTDLRKLSEWIKLKRDVEQLKKSGE